MSPSYLQMAIKTKTNQVVISRKCYFNIIKYKINCFKATTVK